MDHTAQTLIPQRRLVALEALITSDMSGLVRRVMPSIQSGIKGFREAFGQAPAVGVTSDQKRFLSDVVAKRTYNTLEPLTAYVPQGLKVTYLEYAQVLYNAVEHAATAPQVINEYATFLAQLVSNKMSLSVTSSKRRLYQDMQETRLKLAQEVQKCFDNTARSETKVENVIKRNSEWSTLFVHCENISRVINSVERSVLQKKVDECTDLLDAISRQIAEGHFDKASPEVLLDLSEGAYQVASELEFYSVMYYNAQTFTHAVTRTLERITKVSDQKMAA